MTQADHGCKALCGAEARHPEDAPRKELDQGRDKLAVAFGSYEDRRERHVRPIYF